MSFRLLTTRLYKHGRLLVHSFFKRDIHTSILDKGRNRAIPRELKSVSTAGAPIHQLRTGNSFFRIGSQARRLFVDNVLNRVTNPYSAELRAQAAKRLMFGDSAPFFALVGVSLASGDGVLTKDDELEAVCWEIRNAITYFQTKSSERDIEKRLDEELGLNQIDIGPPLAKGCSAVVYAAALKDQDNNDPIPAHSQKEDDFKFIPQTRQMSQSPNTNLFAQGIGGSVDNLQAHFNKSNNLQHNLYEVAFNDFQKSASGARGEQRDANISNKRRVRFDSESVILERSRLLSDAIDSYNDIQYMESDLMEKLHEYNMDASLEEYPLALKMMFNYDIQSNAMSILKAMYKETVPAKSRNISEMDTWEKRLMDQTAFLPPHPNIVEMYGVFCDQVPDLQMASTLYPMALPPRLNPSGYGRNMSLFLLMKRYNCSLQDYLTQTTTMDMRTRILLFTQLLEAVAHMNRYGVAHRDLKSDNILIELRQDMPPSLVLSDFGCCIADKTNGLQIPYTSQEMDKGGNTALMAPEIITKQPGTFSVLDYNKADLWACGTIAYEIFGSTNPFYGNKDNKTALKSSDYKETDLPDLSDNVPNIVKLLVENILCRNPNKRLSADVAANVMQLYLWCPSSWLKNFTPSSNDILQWLLSLTTKILCEGRLQVGTGTMGRRTYPEYLLISSFLARANIRRIKRALEWIYSTQD
ncbi:serine/threonine-protein kinase Pink1, mitochondrial isoform X2 [Uranotaenia lowii]|uniref:serine/threonine-protein kinase Pink1, mitochondrial isoform X2 n=1 Tax=Uranotaenia lowii TaxID=190385 RepID=UPI00247ABAF2|nr:serine/threonine-protein kinase Pink1, mitochondrial isoform X2 [Uranotaenia lowii]